MTLLHVVLFFLGTIVASFMGVVAARLSTGQSFVRGRSRCDVCETPLGFRSLIPLLSYVGHRGRAVCCNARLSPLAPLSELLLGALFVLSYLRLGFSWGYLTMIVALGVLLGLVLYDLAHQILPPSLLTIFVIVSAVTGLLTAGSFFFDSLVVAAVLGGILALIHLLSRGRAMGFADAPLAFGLALLTGDAALSGFLFSFWIGAAIGIIILLMRPRGHRIGVEVPFAPFLAAGFLLAYFTQWNPLIFIAAFH